jgi:hypothetical protein
MEIKAYATSIGEAHQTVFDQLYAAEVADAVPHARNELANVPYKTLAKIRVAQRWLWPVLVAAMLGERWTVKETQARVARLKHLPADPPKWLSVYFLERLLSGTVLLDDLERIKDVLATTAAALHEIERQRALASGNASPGESFGEMSLEQQMTADEVSFFTHADAFHYCDGVIKAARQRLTEVRQAETKEPNQAASGVKTRRVTVQKKKRKIQHPELFPGEPLPAPLDAKQSNEKGVRSDETKDEEPVPSNRVTERTAATREASDEPSKKLFVERHARVLRRRARYRHFRIGKSVQTLATIPIPRPDNLDQQLSPRYQAKIREALPKARAALEELHEMFNGSSKANE